MLDKVQKIKSLIEKDIDHYKDLTGKDCSEELGGALLGYICTAHLDQLAFEFTAFLGLNELEKKLSEPGMKISLKNTFNSIAEIKYLSENKDVEGLLFLKKYANNLMGYKID